MPPITTQQRGSEGKKGRWPAQLDKNLAKHFGKLQNISQKCICERPSQLTWKKHVTKFNILSYNKSIR